MWLCGSHVIVWITCDCLGSYVSVWITCDCVGLHVLACWVMWLYGITGSPSHKILDPITHLLHVVMCDHMSSRAIVGVIHWITQSCGIMCDVHSCMWSREITCLVPRKDTRPSPAYTYCKQLKAGWGLGTCEIMWYHMWSCEITWSCLWAMEPYAECIWCFLFILREKKLFLQMLLLNYFPQKFT